MRDLFLFIVSVLSTTTAQNEVHFVPAHILCPNVTGDKDILLPSPTDCAVYYKCENGMAIPQFCPEGLEWCKILSECTLPMLANCTITHTVVTYSPEELATYHPYASTTEGTTVTTTPIEYSFCPFDGAKLPNPNNCSLYYTCQDGNVVSQSCPDGEKYSCWDQMCEPDESADCINSGNQAGHACTKENEKIPTLNNCTSYYECVNGLVVEKSCRDGSFFSPWDGKCTNNDTNCEKYLGTTSSTGETTSPTSETTTDTQSTKPPSILCPKDGILYPSYQGDCHGYIECINRQPVPRKCDPPTYNYNCETKKCEDISHCCATGTTGLPGSPTTEPTMTTQGTTGPSGPSETTSPPSVGGDFCPLNGVKLPNPANCSLYYTCQDGNVVSQSCPDGEKYSCWDQMCEPDESADCINSGNQAGHACTKENEKIPTLNNCTSYYECVNGLVVEKSCQDGSFFSPWDGKCTNNDTNCEKYLGTTSSTGETTSPTSETTTDTQSTKPPSILCPKDGILYPSYQGDCHGYMECINRQPVPKKCDPPTYNYNCETKKCENISHCCATGTSTSESTTTTTTSETTSPILSPSPTNNICPVDGAKLPNPIDCSSYYVCQNNNPVSQKCPQGEEYSCWDQTCKKPEHATCIKQGSQQGHSCSNEGEQNPVLDDCSYYYKCTNGKIEIVKCAAGTLYNSWFKACFNYTLSWCKTYPTIPPSSTIEPPPSTKGPSDTENICPMEGAKLPNVLDCNSFYVCLNNLPVLKSCPSNEAYSCWDQQCLPETESHCFSLGNSPGDNCTIDGLQAPDIHDCRNYFECRNNSLIEMTCPEGTMYNSWFKKCVADKYAYCQTISTPSPTGPTTTTVATTQSSVSPKPDVCPDDGAQLPNPTDCNAYYVCQNGKPVPHTCPKGQEYSCWDQKCEMPSSNSTCIKDGNQEGHSCSIIGEKLPNIANCSSFYICVNGRVELHVCAGGAIYSEWFKICIDISVFGQIALEFCKTFPTLPPFTLPPMPTTTQPPQIGRDICPVNHALLPNPLDCSTYYECISNTPLLQKCPVGMEYSCWDQKCVNGSDGECIATVGTVTPGQSCPKDGVKVGDAKDCTKYYSCVSGKIVARSCLLGLQYNDRFQKCVLPSYSHCQPINSSVTTTPKPSKTTTISPLPGSEVCPNDGALLPNLFNCSTYYKCVNNTPVMQLCAAGLEYSCWDMACMAPADAKCIATGISVGQECDTNGEKLPNPDDCHSYYECNNGQTVLKKCFLNGYYNKWFHICVPLEILAHCSKNDKPVTTTSTARSTTILPSGTIDICPLNGAILPNPTDCNGYYKCINHQPVAQKCPNGQEYSCWDQICESASSAKCIATGSQRGQNCSREGVTLQNVDSCNSYFACHNGIVEQNNCFFGFEYNRWYQRCTLALYSHCKTSPIITTPPTITTTTISPTIKYPHSMCPTDGVKIPNPNDCHTYFVCENKVPVLHSCPQNQNYDCWMQNCNFALLTRCVNAQVAYEGQDCSVEGETIPNIKNCKKYFECDNGQIVQKTCPFFQQYSIWGKKCKYIGIAECANGKWLGII